MPDAPKPPVTFSFNETSFEAKVNKLKAARDSVAGKLNHNPFFWYKENVQPCVDSYNKGVRTEELYKKLMAIEETVSELKKPI